MPFDKVNNSGIVYVWIGSKSDEDEAKLAEEIANKLYDTVSMEHFACCNRCIIKKTDMPIAPSPQKRSISL